MPHRYVMGTLPILLFYAKTITWCVYLDMLELCMVPQLENIPTIRHFSTLW
jgi:hypothetical protein